MSNIYKAFENKNIFMGFLVAGHLRKDETIDYILKMEIAGANLIEIRIPFSDPVDEEIIKKVNIKALNRKITINKVFEMIKNIRNRSDVPIVFSSYINPVYKYGYNKFFNECKKANIGGIIFLDVPFEERNEIEKIANEYEVDIISIIAPTSKDRLEKISKEAKGFIYILPYGDKGKETFNYLRKTTEDIKKNTNIPCVFNFEIKDINKLKEISNLVNGIVIKEDIIKIIEKQGKEELFSYIKKIKKAME